MTTYCLGNTDLSPYLWQTAKVDDLWAHYLISIDRRLHAIEPALRFDHMGPGRIVGCRWRFAVDEHGNGVGEDLVWHDKVKACWEISLSYLGPLITAMSWSDPNKPPDPIPDPNLVTLVQSIAQDLNLTYLDAHALMALEIPWDELQGDAHMRLDWSEMPTAFNLLFFEY